jgi:hypothetical protein
LNTLLKQLRLLVLPLLLAVGLVVPSASLAVGNFDNAVIADYAIGHYPNGSYGGQCRAFVNNVVSASTQLNVGTGWPDYFAGFENAGAQRITNVADLRKGDIVQSGQTEADPHLHTFIIVGLVSGNLFDVIDSNHNVDEKVYRYNRSVSLSDSVRGYRLGAVSGVGGVAGGVGTRLVGDVNGDGKADAIVMYRDTGTAYVGLSNGSNSFGSIQVWAYQHTVGASKYLLGDVNGDGRADLVAFWTETGRWRVSLSSGSGFWAETDWAIGQGANTNNQFLGDVNGDGKADAVTFDASNGDWYISSSTGTGFGPNQQFWAHGHGVGSSNQAVADFNGDRRADIGFYFAANGAWHVGLSTGTGFAVTQWSAGHGIGSDKRVLGDVNGDKKADTGYFFLSLGHWDIGMSSGSGIFSPIAWAANQGNNTTDQFFADANGDGMSDFVSYDNGTGDWRVSLSSGTGFWSPSLWLSGMGMGS